MVASESGEKWLVSGYILNIDPLGSKFISMGSWKNRENKMSDFTKSSMTLQPKQP